jgi:glyoxylase-like metal-dependent hydrolase (beta-lactamase superfamily II)
MQLHTIDTGYFKLDGGAMFGVVPKSIWSRTNPADDNNLCTWAARLLLIEDGGKLILVDTGLGNKQDDSFFRHYHRSETKTLEQVLNLKGFTSGDVTDVILTHLHFDHVGGAVERKGERLLPTFAQAKYWCHPDHWAWAMQPNVREKASFLSENLVPLQESGQLHWVTPAEANAIHPNLQLRVVHGHTEAMLLPQLTYKGRTCLYMADLLPSVGHIPLPYVMGYDVRPLVTMEEKKQFWQEAIEGDYVLLLEHDAQHACCTLQMTEKGPRLKEAFQLQDL